MSKYKIPIDFVVEAESGEAASLRLDEFLDQAVFTWRRPFDIVSYDSPVGYPVEALDG